MGDPEGALALELEGDLEDGVDLLLGPLLEADEVAAAQVRLHRVPLYSAAPRMSERSDILSTTPLNASTQ